MSTSIAEDGDATISNVEEQKEAPYIAAAKEWISYDPNPTTVQYVQRLIDSEAHDELQSLFPADSNERISFGTAGLRGKMRPGPLYMNDLVVIQTAQGIASYCKSCISQDNTASTSTLSTTSADDDVKESQAKRPRIEEGIDADSDPPSNKWGIVIGYDHRSTSADSPYQLSSLQFALYTTLVFQKAGFHDVLLLDGYVATPMVPFTVVRRGCVIDDTATTHWMGIMITASHNPKEDAGYKIYRGPLGCQIQSPTDQQMAQHILENTQLWMDYRKALEGIAVDGYGDPCRGLSQPQRTKDIVAAYFDALVHSGLCTGQGRLDAAAKVPIICYTAMHGVGYHFARQVFTHFGLPRFHSVPIQQEPDPEFPTVQFPNPEEKGALDMAKLFASTRGCNIILANDPDADRLAVAEYDGGRWTEFTGDQIGALLGHWLWQTQSPKDNDSNVVLAMCASTVSSRLLSEMARVEGFHYEDTLTGFKWIGSRAATLHGSPVPEQPGKAYRSIFCYEEAIGFCCGNVIFDKDGISALAVFAELCHSVYRSNRTLSQHLQSLYDRYGEFVSKNGYFFVSDPNVVTKIMDAMTNHGKFDTLEVVGPYKVASFRYLGVPGYDSLQPDHQPLLPCSKSSPMMTIRFVNGCIAQFRGSGTEPKLKYYLELPGAPGVPRDAVGKELEEMSEILLEALLQPEKNGLRRSRH